MTVSISLYLDQLEIWFESPENHFSLICLDKDRNQVDFYCSREQWWALRQVIKKSPGYFVNVGGKRFDGDEAEAEIQRLYGHDADAALVDLEAVS
jgi:hypothetical protein